MESARVSYQSEEQQISLWKLNQEFLDICSPWQKKKKYSNSINS